MLTITDCGCSEHQSHQVIFNGVQATMMERFISNLPINGLNYTYICEYGHTHRVIPHFPHEKIVALEYGGLAQEARPIRFI
jgi:hypothetical protein